MLSSKDHHNSAIYAGMSALLAFIACNGLLFASALLATFGITFNIAPSLQAVLISLFAILTAVFVFKGFVTHHRLGPLTLATLGALVIVLTMYVAYSKAIESAGLVALLAATWWNWWVLRRQSACHTKHVP